MESLTLDETKLVEALTCFSHSKFLVAISLILVLIYLYRKPNHVYLVDFICFRAPDCYRVPVSSFLEHAEILEKFDRSTISFHNKVVERSGIGNETYLPTGIHMLPPDDSLSKTMEEIETVLFYVVQKLFAKHKIDPKSIDILVTNCSLICPTPSLAASIINKFGFKSDVQSFNLSGMGCSAGILSLSLARDLLKVHKNSQALILSMESICSYAYPGKVKSMVLPNCLFRMGGTAVLLSNKKNDRINAKYELKHIVRTHLGSKTNAYNCVIQQTDDEGYCGVSLSRTILQVSAEALKINIRTLGFLVLPYSEQIRYVLSAGWWRVWAPARKQGPYIPNFKKAFNHFCLHAGGKAIIETIKEKLKLTGSDVEACKMSLHRFGNTSSSSTWYTLGYLEAKGRVKRGDIVWQLGFGSGFKCNSAVWKCISDIKPDSYNVWSDMIHRYPVEIPEVIDH